MKTQQSQEMYKRAVCVVETGGALDTKPLKVKVWLQKLGVWWRCLPRSCYKKVAAFGFHWEEVWHPRQAYISLPADMDVGRLQKASARSGDALVKMVVTHSCGKATTTTPVAEFVRRLGEEGPEGFVLQLSMASGNTEARKEQHTGDESEGVGGQGKAESEGTEGQGEAEGAAPWVGKTCKCPSCVLPFWGLLRAWEPLPVKPPTAMDTYVDILAAECAVLKKEGEVLLKGKRSCTSELAALQAEMERMERELDRAEASWASVVTGECDAEASEHLEGTDEEGFSCRDEELWGELLADGIEGCSVAHGNTPKRYEHKTRSGVNTTETPKRYEHKTRSGVNTVETPKRYEHKTRSGVNTTETPKRYEHKTRSGVNTTETPKRYEHKTRSGVNTVETHRNVTNTRLAAE
ncbi:hypothetical protein O3P69_017768 [Scylla paramamosain]|uniref:Uncharacterized protein n=1 Tax=Scylla paramamosain TaxID=85552 RepID=A0AAW0SB67_SCYPA